MGPCGDGAQLLSQALRGLERVLHCISRIGSRNGTGICCVRPERSPLYLSAASRKRCSLPIPFCLFASEHRIQGGPRSVLAAARKKSCSVTSNFFRFPP